MLSHLNEWSETAISSLSSWFHTTSPTNTSASASASSSFRSPSASPAPSPASSLSPSGSVSSAVSRSWIASWAESLPSLQLPSLSSLSSSSSSTDGIQILNSWRNGWLLSLRIPSRVKEFSFAPQSLPIVQNLRDDLAGAIKQWAEERRQQKKILIPDQGRKTSGSTPRNNSQQDKKEVQQSRFVDSQVHDLSTSNSLSVPISAPSPSLSPPPSGLSLSCSSASIPSTAVLVDYLPRLESWAQSSALFFDVSGNFRLDLYRCCSSWREERIMWVQKSDSIRMQNEILKEKYKAEEMNRRVHQIRFTAEDERNKYQKERDEQQKIFQGILEERHRQLYSEFQSREEHERMLYENEMKTISEQSKKTEEEVRALKEEREKVLAIFQKERQELQNKFEEEKLKLKLQNQKRTEETEEALKKMEEENAKNRQTLENMKREYYLCTVCLDNARDCVVMPCGHFCLCESCANDLKQCCFCRAEITNRIRIFSA